MLLELLLTSAVAGATLNVLIDPGHGGRDHGTTRDNVKESEITLDVGRRVAELLAKDKRFRVRLTRADDRHLSLSERARLARDFKSDVFLSVHVNSNPDARARGAEFYFQNQLPSDEESMFLAHRENELESGEAPPPAYEFLAKNKDYPVEVAAIVTDLLDGDRILRSSQLTQALKSVWRGTRKNKSMSVRQAPFFVLSQIQTPSALVELGFMTNIDDFRDLTAPLARAKMAEDLYRGLIQYMESITNGHASR